MLTPPPVSAGGFGRQLPASNTKITSVTQAVSLRCKLTVCATVHKVGSLTSTARGPSFLLLFTLRALSLPLFQTEWGTRTNLRTNHQQRTGGAFEKHFDARAKE